ncbi:hypothetical protein MKX03_012217 [Papaver bracteatum]|nr:hypothetical protein MKX03_012217 [Papaver bracteatum]
MFITKDNDKSDATFWPLKLKDASSEFDDSKSMKYSSCTIYFQPACIPYLAKAWTERSVVDITQYLNFFMDIATDPFEKYCRITMLETAKAALTKFSEAFNGRPLASGSSIHVIVSTSNSVTLAFTEDGSTSKQEDVTLDCKETIIFIE